MRFRLLLVLSGLLLVTSVGAATLDVPGSYPTIQAAMTAASDGDIIQVAAGTYDEMVSITKSVTLRGANWGIHPAVGTHGTETVGTRGPETILSHNGLYALNPQAADITVDGFKFTGSGGRFLDTYANADNFHLTNTIIDANGPSNQTGYLQFGGGSHNDLRLDFNLIHLTGDVAFLYCGGGPYDRLKIEYNKLGTAGDAVFWTATPLDDGIIRGNDIDGTISGVPGTGLCTMNIGQAGDLTIEANHIHDVYYTAFQVGIVGGTVSNNTFERIYPYGSYAGEGLQLWGGQWGTAVSTNVTITGNTFSFNDIAGSSPTHAIRLRPPEIGTGIDGTTIHIHENTFTNGNQVAGAYAIRHQGDQTTAVDATLNYFGTSSGTLIASWMSGPVVFSPFYASPPGTSPMTWGVAPGGSIQAAINAADPGDTIEVAAGLYTERLVVDRPLTLLGATRTVNKNGYTVPSGYAWNPNVETIVNYPDPTGLAEGLSQVVDIVADDVTFKGFVVQLLNARCDFNGDNLLRVNAGLPGGPGQTRDNVVVENNVLGPTTNVSSQTGTCGRMGLYLASPSYAAQFQGITNSSFKGNKIIDARGNGDNVFIWGSAESYFSLQDADYTGTVIEDNEITGSHRSGIEIAGGVNGLTIRDNVIANCSSTNGGSEDPNLKYGSGIVVIRMGGDKTSPTARGAHHLTITGNVIRDNEKNGIYLGPFNTDHTIADNIITGNGATGLRVDLTEAYYGGTWPVLGVTANIDAGDNIIAGNLAGAAVTGVPSNGFRLDALGCWWGSASGPLHPTENPTGTGNSVSDYIDFNPWLTGIIVTNPDPLDLTVVPNNQGDIVVSYLGGMGGIYGYSIDVVWNNAIAAAVPADFTRPATGPFATAQLFQVVNLGAGHVRVDAGLGGNQPGIPAGPLFKAHFTAAGGQGTQTPVDLTVAYIMDYASPPVINVPADDGLIRVDTVAPVVTNVLVTNTSTGSTLWLRNGQNISVTATVIDGAPLTVTCDLEDFGGGAAVAPDGLPVGGVYTWTLNNVTCNPADGPVTATVTATDALANVSTGSDAITADNTLPDPLQNLLARPGHQKVHLSWGDASGNDDNYAGVELRYVVRTNYPQYDDVAVPAYPANHNEGTLALQATGTAVDWTIVPRDIYYLAGFVYDLAGNYSVTPGSPTNQDAATNYWLGDVYPAGSWDGLVTVLDVNALGESYGLDEGMVGFNAQCDVGPTDDWSPTGLPLPDDVIGFFDLMVFAMNFGEVSPTLEFTPGALPALAWRQLDETSWVLALTGECAGLKGLNLSAELPEGVSCQVQPGALLSRQDAPVFMRNIPQHGLDAGLAVLGQGVGIAGAGELMVVTFSEPVTGLEIEVLARDLNNDELLAEMAGTTGVEIPIVASLAQNYPNPFNPQTTIEFGLPRPEQVRISVYSVNGARIRTLVDEARPAGVHRVIWDGRDEAGRCAATGAYFYKIDAGDFHQVRKMILVK